MCPVNVKLQAFKGLILPVHEYASAARDLYELCLQDNLEKDQRQSARFDTGNYSYEPGLMTSILNQLKLPPLQLEESKTVSSLCTKHSQEKQYERVRARSFEWGWLRSGHYMESF